jgi:prepilin-type N-terminal cleavage/methylation domain-containing protein
MRKAFTLIELLIVVAIIAILAAIAVPNFLEAQTRAKVSRAKADMRTFATALESYTVDNNKPMTSWILGATSLTFTGPSIINSSFTGINWVSPRFKRLTTPISYLTSVLPDPFAKDGVTLQTGGPVSSEYDTFDYWSAYDLGPGGVTELTTPLYRGAGVTGGASWRIVSAGPDKIQAFGGSTIDVAASTNMYGVDYDPTNGTISRGDIVRIGSGAGPISGPPKIPAIDRIHNKYNQAGL